MFNKLRQPAVKVSQNELSLRQLSLLEAAHVNSDAIYIDPLTQRYSSLLPSVEMFNPQVFKNSNSEQQTKSIEQLFKAWLVTHQELLNIKPSEVTLSVGKVGNEHFNIHGFRQYQGVPVRLAGMTAVIKQGRLLLFGMQNWIDVDISVEPTRKADEIEMQIVTESRNLAQNYSIKSQLVIFPRLDQAQILPTLAWEVSVKSADGSTNKVVVVNDFNGEVMNINDSITSATNHRNVNGGIYPFSNDGLDEIGDEYSRYPMPYVYVHHNSGTATTGFGGNVEGVTGILQTELKGPYVEIIDGCGLVNESSLGIELNLGVSSGTDCATPLGASAGNTHAARNAFYHINQIMAGARSVLTSNSWLNQPLKVQVNNMSNQCNAIWNGDDILTYVSSAACANFGELAGVLFHEFTHGLDDNGTNPGTTFPNEGITDLMAALKTNQSCPARGAFPGTFCSGFGDVCLECDGTNDVDWAKHASGIPHDLAWVDANCSALDQYCKGVPVAETLWDLYQRDLPSIGMDTLTARNLTTQWTLAAADLVGNWYNSSGGSGDGCNADGGFLNFLAADDDNGDLNDGTPHMQAIFAAFDRHGIACATPTVTDSGCSNEPTTAPQLTFNTDKNTAAVTLDWAALAGANSYSIYRGEGIEGCDSMMNLVATTASPTHQDVGLQIGRTYFYSVNGVGSGSSCYGPSSGCISVLISDLIFANGFDD
jgi:hypothetical protein